jgi:hypothetical protein
MGCPLRRGHLPGADQTLTRWLERGTPLLLELWNQAQANAAPLATGVVHAQPQAPGQWVIGYVFGRKLTPAELTALLEKAEK